MATKIIRWRDRPDAAAIIANAANAAVPPSDPNRSPETPAIVLSRDLPKKTRSSVVSAILSSEIFAAVAAVVLFPVLWIAQYEWQHHGWVLVLPCVAVAIAVDGGRRLWRRAREVIEHRPEV